MYPKLKFHIITFEYELKLFQNFLSPIKANYFKESFLYYYPVLKDPKTDLSKFIISITNKKKEVFLRNQKRYTKEWKLIERKFHKILTSVLNINWSKEQKYCNTELSLVVVFPRYLYTYYFVVAGESAIDRVMGTCAHEITHFLYFKKFKELYPDVSKNKYW